MTSTSLCTDLCPPDNVEHDTSFHLVVTSYVVLPFFSSSSRLFAMFEKPCSLVNPTEESNKSGVRSGNFSDLR